MGMQIGSIPEPFLNRVRSEGIDDLGQPVKRVVAQGGEPCRDVLRRAKPGEELILASFTPFTKAGPFKEYGPIYVLANPSDEDVKRDGLPPAGLKPNSPSGWTATNFAIFPVASRTTFNQYVSGSGDIENESFPFSIKAYGCCPGRTKETFPSTSLISATRPLDSDV
jgi:hypothetical protein